LARVRLVFSVLEDELSRAIAVSRSPVGEHQVAVSGPRPWAPVSDRYRQLRPNNTTTGKGRPMAAKVEIYKDTKGEFRWRLKSANGQTIATGGEGYASKSGCENGIAAVKRDAPEAAIEDA
jgi:uncharacterized protein YegP (UPF0339 family)